MAAPQTQTITGKNQNLTTVAELGFSHPDGERFSYWTETRDGTGQRYYDGKPIMIDRNTTLYAQWGNCWIVNFDSQGGTACPTRTIDTGAAVGTLPTTTRTDYDFENWWTEPTGGTQVAASTAINQDVTFYAHWTAHKYETNELQWLRFEDGCSTPDELLFADRAKGKYKLTIKKMNIVHYGSHDWHKIFVNLMVVNKSNTRQYAYLPMSSSNTVLDGGNGLYYSTRTYYINGKSVSVSQLYGTGHKNEGGTGYFQCDVTVNLPYAHNNIYISADPADGSDCSGALRFNDPGKAYLTRIN